MQPALPTIRQRITTVASPWVTVVGKEVLLPGRERPEVYHCLAQSDYVSILACTPSKLVPLVRQYRPAVEQFTLELPAGLCERGEAPEETCRRELQEETGLTARTVRYLGAFFPDTGRLENRMHAFFVEASDPDPAFRPEPGLEVSFVTAQALGEAVVAGHFNHALHLSVLASAAYHGWWDAP